MSCPKNVKLNFFGIKIEGSHDWELDSISNLVSYYDLYWKCKRCGCHKVEMKSEEQVVRKFGMLPKLAYVRTIDGEEFQQQIEKAKIK